MSHFNCLVIHKEEQDIAELMAPYSEDLKVKPYIEETKEKCYKEYLRAKNDAKNKRNSFFGEKQKKEADIIGMSFEKFKKWYWGKNRLWDEEGNLLTTYNPNSRWGYYLVGGKWENLLIKKNGSGCNNCLIAEVNWKKSIMTYAVVTPDGRWHGKGKMLYFGVSDETEKQAQDWKLNFYSRFIEPHLGKQFYVTILDCHN